MLPQLADGYVDLLAACDVVVTKPGYGIVADLIANRVPALYVSRGGFREEPVLVHALEDGGAGRQRWSGRRWTRSISARPLERLLALDRPWTERRLDGAEVVARRVLEIAVALPPAPPSTAEGTYPAPLSTAVGRGWGWGFCQAACCSGAGPRVAREGPSDTSMAMTASLVSGLANR